MFKKAQRHKIKARIAIDGPTGSGKTYTALRAAFALGEKVAVIDTEHGSAEKYAGESPDGFPWDFAHCLLTNYAPDRYERAIQAAVTGGFDVLVIDSLSHAWIGEGGVLDIVDKAKGNKFTNGWANATPMQRRMIDTILAAPLHVICTMRTKTEYVLEADERGKMVPRKVGMAPVQRDGVEYEFDVVMDIDTSHIATVTKSRCSKLQDAKVVKPGPDFWHPFREWLNVGTESTAELAVNFMQRASIESLAARLGLSDDNLSNGIAAYIPGKSSVAELSGLEADTIIAKLEAKLQA